MSWIGYFEYAGTEIINASRVEAYAKSAQVYALRPVYSNAALGPMLGDVYRSPMADDAPWTDPDDLDTYGFLGVYPLDIGGIEDSNLSVPVTESTRDGGVTGRGRYGTKTVTFSVALLGTGECGCAAGMRWLKKVLAGPPCVAGSACGGADLCYLNCAPELDFTANANVSTCIDHYLRTLHDVSTITAPTLQKKSPLTSGGEVWLVTFTLLAGNPFEFGASVPLISGFMDPTIAVPYVGGIVPAGGSFDDDGFVQNDPACPKATYQPLNDPTCPQIIAPPPVPNIALSCFTFPVNYVRRQFVIPKAQVPLWGDVVPYMAIKARSREVRNLRLRFYADVFESGNPNDDPCNFCGDIVFSYIPAGAEMVLDGVNQQVYVENIQQGRRQASSLVYASDGGPFEWPLMSCGFGYIVTIDLPQATPALPIVDFSLYSRAA